MFFKEEERDGLIELAINQGCKKRIAKIFLDAKNIDAETAKKFRDKIVEQLFRIDVLRGRHENLVVECKGGKYFKSFDSLPKDKEMVSYLYAVIKNVDDRIAHAKEEDTLDCDLPIVGKD